MRYRLDCLPLGVAGLLVTLLPSTALPHPLLGSRATPAGCRPCLCRRRHARGRHTPRRPDPGRSPSPGACRRAGDPGRPCRAEGDAAHGERQGAAERPDTVVVVDDACRPVTGATVTIRTRSLEMDHGVRTTTAEEVASGRYLAERVPMGMAGDWEAVVTVERPGADAAVVVFVLTLESPR